MKNLKISMLIAAAMLFVSCKNKTTVDTIIYAKTIYTGTDTNTNYSSIAIKDGKIVAIDTKDGISGQYLASETIEKPGSYIYPGFIDAHCHFSGYALTRYMCDLTGTRSFEEVIYRLLEYDKTNHLAWIYGRGWDQNDWKVKEFPNNRILDSLFLDKPLIIKRIDGHALLCNSKALAMAGINIRTRIPGGIIEQKNERLTGILVDNAADLVDKLIGSLPEKDAIEQLKAAENECYSYGLTGVVDCGVKGYEIELLKKLYNNNTLSICNTLLLSGDKETIDKYLGKGVYKGGQLTITGVKLYADGALGSRGACLLKEYSDMPVNKGLILTNKEDIQTIAERALKNGLQVCTHAIGDSANRIVLKIYAGILKTTNDKRWRVEHAQVVNYNDYMYFRQYKIVPSIQPTHATSDMPWAENRLGKERITDAYQYKKLLQQNGWAALGTDFPVEAINPIATFYAAVSRKDKEGNPKKGFMIDQALSRTEALKGMTIWAAKSVFNEKEKGSLEIGKDADIVILDKDIMTVAEKEILNTKVLYTIVKGKVKYKKE